MKKLLILLSLVLPLLAGCTLKCKTPDATSRQVPAIYPDYSGVTFPDNIAAPNFVIKAEGDKFQTEIGCGDKVSITCVSGDNRMIIPLDEWHEFSKEARGKDIFFRITIKKDGKWTRYADIVNHIDASSIDPYLAYRLLYPGYEVWNDMGIYQRNLTNYDQEAILENKQVGKQCMNCHTFCKNSPNTMMLHIRGKQGGTLIYKNGILEKVSSKVDGMENGCTYPAWHPSGQFIAFSMNNIKQGFHSSGCKPIEVIDMSADIAVYDVKANKIFTDSAIYGKQSMETFPTWSPDGKYIYFCRGNNYNDTLALNRIHYDLCRISFDAATHKFGKVECIINATAMGKSVSFPRVSPDGKYLLFTMSNYGNFSIWHAESDLCLLDLSTGKNRVLSEVNSNQVESFHTWSSTGQWFVFSSKRMDGLWSRPFFSHFDSRTGRATKPFVLPQEDPCFYDNFTRTFNLPELITGPVTIGKEMPAKIALPARKMGKE